MGDAHADVWDRLDQAPDSTLVAFFTDFEHIFQEGTSFIESDLLSETPSSSCQSLDRPARINGGEGYLISRRIKILPIMICCCCNFIVVQFFLELFPATPVSLSHSHAF